MSTPIIPNPPVPFCLRVDFHGTDGSSAGNPWMNTEFFKYTGTPPSIPSCENIAAQAWQAWTTNFLPNLPPPFTFDKVVVTDLNSSTGGQGEYVQSQVGTSTNDKLPASTCVVISKIISERYRGGRPRVYSPVVADGNLQDPSHINTAYQATMQDNYFNFRVALLAMGSGSTSILAHICVAYFGHSGPVGSPEYFPGTTKRLNPLTFDIQNFTVDLQLGSQRRRIGRAR